MCVACVTISQPASQPAIRPSMSVVTEPRSSRPEREELCEIVTASVAAWRCEDCVDVETRLKPGTGGNCEPDFPLVSNTVGILAFVLSWRRAVCGELPVTWSQPGRHLFG